MYLLFILNGNLLFSKKIEIQPNYITTIDEIDTEVRRTIDFFERRLSDIVISGFYYLDKDLITLEILSKIGLGSQSIEMDKILSLEIEKGIPFSILGAYLRRRYE